MCFFEFCSFKLVTNTVYKAVSAGKYVEEILEEIVHFLFLRERL